MDHGQSVLAMAATAIIFLLFFFSWEGAQQNEIVTLFFERDSDRQLKASSMYDVIS